MEEDDKTVGSAKFLGTDGSSEDILQRFFDLTLKQKFLEEQIKMMRPAVLEMLKTSSPRIVKGGVIELKWKAAPSEYSADLFDLFDIEQIKRTAKFQAGLIKSESLLEEARSFLVSKADVASLHCIPAQGSEVD